MQKLDRLEQQLSEREREYRALLMTALQECARGRWGLFGHNEHLGEYGTAPEVSALEDLAGIIDHLRGRLGREPYSLHVEFNRARGRAGPNDVGEPKQAQAWLERIAGA